MENIILNSIQRTLDISIGKEDLEKKLSDDLGADSIDILDILFSVGRETGVQLRLTDIGRYVRGDLTENQFQDENGFINNDGLKQLKNLFPNLTLNSKIQVQYIFELLSVADFIKILKQLQFEEINQHANN